MNATDTLLCALLRDSGAAPRALPPPEDAWHFVERARLHGVLPLVDERLASLPNRAAWPKEVLGPVHDAAIAAVVVEALQHQELVRVLGTLAQAGVAPILMKGAALAESHYPRPSLRPRSDADMLVPEAEVAAAEGAFAGLGYAREPGVAGAYVSYQACWTRHDSRGIAHRVDLHWKVNNAQVLARSLDYAELSAHAVTVPALGPHARALSPAYALLLACMHRAGHMADPHLYDGEDHAGGDWLIWLYDIHLLLSRMTGEESDRFVALAAAKRMKAVCLDALARTAECLGTEIPASVMAGLDAGRATEPSARLLDGKPFTRMLGDFGAIDGLGGRLRLLRELAFPSAEHMRRKFAGAAFRWLPWLYLRRAASGAWRLFSR